MLAPLIRFGKTVFAIDDEVLAFIAFSIGNLYGVFSEDELAQYRIVVEINPEDFVNAVDLVVNRVAVVICPVRCLRDAAVVSRECECE